MAAAAAGRAAAAAAGMSAANGATENSREGVRGSLMMMMQGPASARPGGSIQSMHPRLVAISTFFGAGVDRSVLRSSSNGSGPWSASSVVNEVAVDGTSNSSATKLEVPSSPEKAAPDSASPTPSTDASAFLADVANLVKLVDTRDIVELELKNKDYELVIRKKEALPPPPAPPQMSSQGPHVMAHTMFPGYQPQPQTLIQPSQEEPTPAPTPAPVPDAIPPAAEHPPMLSPMAGTFYRSPGPGEAQFVKVGDKVTKGQVVCIVEAMKLMNEIEADQSGTIVEICAEDAKPVSIESPLFVIKP